MARRSSTKVRRDNLPVRRGDKGRPTSLTPATEDTLLHNLISGVSVDASCALAGVGLSTFYTWMKRGEQARHHLNEHGSIDDAEIRYLNFRESVLDARAQAEQRMVGVVMKAAHGGFVTQEEPLLDIDGQPLRDDDGNILKKITRTGPDGRLALSYLQRARPRDWSSNTNVNVNANASLESTDGGDSPNVTVEVTQVTDLAERLAEVRRQHEEDEEIMDVIEGEIVEDDSDD